MEDKYYEVGRGWYQLVNPLVFLCESHGGTITQIKEKYGTLRFYYASVEGGEDFWEYFDNLVYAMESCSAFVCEKCGSPGKLRGKTLDGGTMGWVSTLCDECAKERGYA